jgi:hypothetical protein
MDGSTAEEIIAVREQETGIIRTFTEQSRLFFVDSGWSEVSCPDVVPGSIHIVLQLSETTPSALGIRHEEWTRESGAEDEIKSQNSTHGERWEIVCKLRWDERAECSGLGRKGLQVPWALHVSGGGMGRLPVIGAVKKFIK